MCLKHFCTVFEAKKINTHWRVCWHEPVCILYPLMWRCVMFYCKLLLKTRKWLVMHNSHELLFHFVCESITFIMCCFGAASTYLLYVCINIWVLLQNSSNGEQNILAHNLHLTHYFKPRSVWDFTTVCISVIMHPLIHLKFDGSIFHISEFSPLQNV